MVTPTLLPAAIRLDPIRAGVTDLRGVDLTGDLTPLNDALSSISSVSVKARDDAASLGAGDLVVITASPDQPFIDSTKMMVGFWLASDETLFANGVTVDYRIQVVVNTSLGRNLIIDAMCLVMPVRG